MLPEIGITSFGRDKGIIDLPIRAAIDMGVVDFLICPVCMGSMILEDGKNVCTACGRITDG